MLKNSEGRDLSDKEIKALSLGTVLVAAGMATVVRDDPSLSEEVSEAAPALLTAYLVHRFDIPEEQAGDIANGAIFEALTTLLVGKV